MDIIKKILHQTSWQMVAKVVSSLSTIIILSLVARNYGTSGTGVYTLAVAYLSFFYIAVDFGINAHVLPNLIKENFGSPFQKLLGLRILWAFVLMILASSIILLWPDVNKDFQQAVLIAIPAILGVGVFATSTALFQGKLKFQLATIASSFGVLITLLLTILVVYLGLGAPDLLFAHAVGLILGAVLSLFLIQSFTKIIPLFDFSYIKKTVSQSWPISLTLLLNIIYFRADAFILTSLKSFAEVGIYNVAYQVFQSLLVIPAFIMNSFYPIMLKDFAEDKPKFINNLLKMSLTMFGLSFVGMLLTLLFAPLVIDIITGGKSFAGSISSLRMLSLGFPAFFVTSVLMWTLIVLKKYKTMLIIYLVGMIFNISLNFILIPAYSYIGASGVTVLSEYLILSLQLVILIPALKENSKSKTQILRPLQS
ncbi:MAG: flippase [Candidatus Daviesbacteria bacterium]|nr:flippase [Candidatus Daviesbacteria bacterium]